MKKSHLLPLLLLAAPLSAHAISYYKNDGGKVTKIDQAAFEACDSVIYRNVADNELPPAIKRKAMGAALRAETVNDTASASKTLKAQAGSCTYGTDAEKLD